MDPDVLPKDAASPARAPAPGRPFPIVGVGASAGGLRAFQELLAHLPEHPGVALVLVTHLDPTHGSMMPEILSKSSRLPVRQVEEGTRIEVDHVYVIKPNTTITLLDGMFKIDKSRQAPGGGRDAIDLFLVSLARERRETAIAVILSGSAFDGAAGVRAIKNHGGIAMAQDDSAEFPSMPQAAAETGAVDYVLSPTDLAREIVRIARHPFVLSPPDPAAATPERKSEEAPFRGILSLLEAQSAVPFLSYKSSTLERRVLRRMALRQLERFSDYLGYLKQNPQELRLLHDELLINFTSFFREPQAFDALRRLAYPGIVEGRSPKSPIRIWVPGCSTGEEAYSLAISLVEFLEEKGLSATIQIFASDVSEPALAKARAGLYGSGIAQDVSPERLQTFFSPAEGGGYLISKRIRDLVLFARQDLTQDPPFSRLDLLSCRNVLIYLGTMLHKRVVPLFHYALRPGGFLVLGTSETADRFPSLFRAVDAKQRIYAKVQGPSQQPPGFMMERHRPGGDEPRAAEFRKALPEFDAVRAVDRAILARYAPPGIVVNEEEQVVDVRGNVSPLLRVPSGKPHWALPRMVQEELLADLEGALREAREKGVPVRREGLLYRVEEQVREVTLCVIPVDGPAIHERLFAVLFEEPGKPPRKIAPPAAPASALALPDPEREMARLRQTLAAQQEYQQAIIEKLENSNEELRSVHEEVLSANEELQSTNEELQTAKEELQSSNEELLTLNDELRSRNLELGQTNDDLQNVLASVQIPMVIVDTMLRIRRITPSAEKLLGIVASDVSRRITEFKPTVEVPNLEALIRTSIDNLSLIEQEVRDRNGRWWLLRVRPYRTAEHKIDGAVLTLLDIDALKRFSIESEERRLFSEAVVQTMRDPLLVLDGRFHVKEMNDSYVQFFRVPKEDVLGRGLYDLGGGQWNIPALRPLLSEILPKNTLFKDFQVEREFPEVGRKVLLLHARQVHFTHSAEPMILLAFEDITDRRETETQIHALNAGLEREVFDRTSKLEGAKGELEAFTYSVAHDLRAPLRAMHGFGQTLLEDYLGKPLDETGRMYLERIIESARRMDHLIQDLLAFSHLGREEVHLESVDLGAIAEKVLSDLAPEIHDRKAEVSVQRPLPRVLAHSTVATQVLTNLVSNAIKFVAPGIVPKVVLRAESANGRERLWVEDNGIGIAKRHHERVFRVFERLNKIEEYPGTGIGLAIVLRAMERMGGEVGFESQVGQGSKFWVEFMKDLS